MSRLENESLILDFIKWENNEWDLNHDDETNKNYIKEFLDFRERIGSCIHEWIPYGKHRMKCVKCSHMKLKNQ